jgi:hypothetical protein
MASSPNPVLLITGQCRAVSRFERIENKETGESRQAARVQVLTDLGGFVEVYVNPDGMTALPAESADEYAPFEPFPVSWNVEVSAWNREAFGQDDVAKADRRRYASLSIRYRSDAARPVRALASA